MKGLTLSRYNERIDSLEILSRDIRYNERIDSLEI